MLILLVGLLGFMSLPFLILAAPVFVWFMVPLAGLLAGAHFLRVARKRHSFAF